MQKCFIIMPFTAELQSIYKDCYEPTIRNNNLEPIVLTEKRDGNPIYSQIVSRIQESHLVIGDLTIARPNCYFEVGYAIGHGKQDNLILCCKYDHYTDHPDNPRQTNKMISIFNLIKSFIPNKHIPFFTDYFVPLLDQYKIHFDLSNYNILWWDPTKKEDFNKNLDNEIKQRIILLQSKIQPVGTASSPPKEKAKMTANQIRQKLNQISNDQSERLK